MLFFDDFVVNTIDQGADENRRNDGEAADDAGEAAFGKIDGETVEQTDGGDEEKDQRVRANDIEGVEKIGFEIEGLHGHCMEKTPGADLQLTGPAQRAFVVLFAKMSVSLSSRDNSLFGAALSSPKKQ